MGKNKRKHDAPTPLAADVTKKNLNKIRKMSKIENPVVTVINIYEFLPTIYIHIMIELNLNFCNMKHPIKFCTHHKDVNDKIFRLDK